jgi:hypothetical protein
MTADGLDGNAAAGILFQAYGREMTAEIGSCTSCGNTGPLAEALAFLSAPGTVLRCRRCQAVLIVLVERGDAVARHEAGVRLAEPS